MGGVTGLGGVAEVEVGEEVIGVMASAGKKEINELRCRHYYSSYISGKS